jgi:hypothetical protein
MARNKAGSTAPPPGFDAMNLDAMMLALRPLQIGAVSLYASWKIGVAADIAA